MAAGTGIAPACAEFQSAAHLSEPSSVYKMVPRRGDAPRSSGYQPGALLLSYRGEWMQAFASRLRSMPARVWENGGAPENRTLDAFWGAAGFKAVSSSMPDVLRCRKVEEPAPGFAPGTTAVRSGVCKSVTPCGHLFIQRFNRVRRHGNAPCRSGTPGLQPGSRL